MPDLATLWKNIVTAVGGASPVSDDLSTLMADFATALSALTTSQGTNTLAKALTTPTVSISDSAMTTVLTSATVPVGTYLAIANLNVLLGSATTSVDAQIVEGTATATVVGGAASYVPSAARADRVEFPVIGVVTVSAPGTVLLQAESQTAAATAEFEGAVVTGGVTSLILVPLFQG